MSNMLQSVVADKIRLGQNNIRQHRIFDYISVGRLFLDFCTEWINLHVPSAMILPHHVDFDKVHSLNKRENSLPSSCWLNCSNNWPHDALLGKVFHLRES